MRKDSIQPEALKKALKMFSERGLEIQDYTHPSTDYYRGTVMEPENISTLKSSFKEYEDLGKQHEEITKKLNKLKEQMAISRQRGAFQSLQNQMKEVKNLVKEREKIDAEMAALDLARKKTDDHRKASGLETSYSEKIDRIGSRIQELESMLLSYSENYEEEM